MTILQAIIMGIIQGLSEFLPISSSAHLVISSNLYKILINDDIIQESNQEIFLDIMLHFGTLIAVLIFFRKEIIEILESLGKGIKTKDFSDKNAKLGLYIIIGTFITVIIAYPLNEIAGRLVFEPIYVGYLLILTGILLCSSEVYSKKITEKKCDIELRTSILMAICQGLAALPGLSRSGLTISAGLLSKQNRLSAARYSFLLSIPIILGASMLYPLIKTDMAELREYNWNAIIIGTIVSTIVGYLCIKYFLKFVSKYSLAFFGYYCIIIGILTSAFFLFISMGL